MFTRKFTGSIVCLVVVALLVMSPAVFAENREVKAVFDFRISDPEVGATVLKWIHQTYKDKELTAIAEKPDFVVIFMGSSPSLLSTNREGVAPEDQKYLDEIATRVSEMVQDGIKLEVCVIAVEDICGMDTASVLSEVDRVAGGWTSLIKYELDGYAPVAAF